MKRTFNYKLPKIQQGDMLFEFDEVDRWKTLDNNLYAIASTCGNGVVSGWDIQLIEGGIIVSAGSGFISGVFIENTTSTTFNSIPSGVYYVYAELVNSGTSFSVSIGYQTSTLDSNQIELAKISVA